MNLFWKKLFGKIASTDDFEHQIDAFENGMKRFLEIESSDDFQEYKRLHETVGSTAFQNRKKELKTRKYKTTDEYKTLAKFGKLAKNKDIRLYFKTKDTGELNDYLARKSNPELGENVLKNNNTDEYKRFEKYGKSKAYRNYVRLNGSYILKEYKELESKIASDKFIKSNEFWKNKKRWEHSEEYFQEERYAELQRYPDIAFCLRQKPGTVEKYKVRKTLFEDNFENGVLDKCKWNYGYHFDPPLIGDFSHCNELQANKSGKNTDISNMALHITTRRDNVVSRAWHPVRGFIEKEFEYASDVVQNGVSFRKKYGVFQIKMRASGNVHHAAWLASRRPLPLISIAQIHDKTISVGVIAKDGTKKTISVTGVNPADYFIYTLIWNKEELIWKINNFEIFRVSHNIPNEEVYLGFNSFLKDTEKPDEGTFEIDWVRIYSSLVNP
jgi:hypothetical protein